jgi:CheY-like chemotaxis protein
METTTKRPILIIEDCHEAYSQILASLELAGIDNPTYRIVFGPDCLDYLHRRMSHQKRAEEPLPALILMDLTLPGGDGRDLLLQIKDCPQFSNIPVVVMSEHGQAAVTKDCLTLGASGVVCKCCMQHVSAERYVAPWLQSQQVGLA